MLAMWNCSVSTTGIHSICTHQIWWMETIKVIKEIDWYSELVLVSAVHGTARTIRVTDFKLASGYVVALRCKKCPASATEWLTLRRPYNCPSKKLIDYFKTLGCFFVCVGHPLSYEIEKPWRNSCSLQERYLVSHFNSVQLKCYVLLKIIKKELISKTVGENCLISYQCKTCMVYIIENIH